MDVPPCGRQTVIGAGQPSLSQWSDKENSIPAAKIVSRCAEHIVLVGQAGTACWQLHFFFSDCRLSDPTLSLNLPLKPVPHQPARPLTMDAPNAIPFASCCPLIRVLRLVSSCFPQECQKQAHITN